ncbi:hypothetical protein ACUXV3_20010 (plasmid) [Roseobacteraceae bacterium NS-SX3]
MIWAAVALITICLTELFLRLPLVAAARSVLDTSRRAARVMRARAISDHWKEKAVQAYAGLMLKAGLRLLAGLGAVALAGAGLAALAEVLVPGTAAALLSGPGLLVSAAAAAGYLAARRQLALR